MQVRYSLVSFDLHLQVSARSARLEIRRLRRLHQGGSRSPLDPPLRAHGISLAKRCWMFCASRRVGTLRAGVAKMGSSPASAPTHSGLRAVAMASATAHAM